MDPAPARDDCLPSPAAVSSVAEWLDFPADLIRELHDLARAAADQPWAIAELRRLDQGLDRTERLEHLPKPFWAVQAPGPDTPDPSAKGWSRCVDLLPLLALLTRVPRVLRLHQQRDVPAAVSRDTLDDLLRWARKFRVQHGRWGLAETHWLVQAVAGRIFRLGRLQFEWVTNRWPALPLAEDAWLLSVHVPEMGPLDHAACDASFDHARRFFLRHFPERRASAYVCDSWLLDPQLAEYLPAQTNIIRFQRRFTVLPEACYPRDEITPRILPTPAAKDTDPAQDARPSRLQQAVAEHRRLGRTWQSGVGYRLIDA